MIHDISIRMKEEEKLAAWRPTTGGEWPAADQCPVASWRRHRLRRVISPREREATSRTPSGKVSTVEKGFPSE
ncbi:unnamed protein product [Angiostrongylus costaricensis]|uniref:Uncharacterized protein n=1 Tax=Angiostrongylus costaricensis TaxID=334426 RepID=A0A0R3PES7_ANGCS|nr:unnamed protein product [Angiostrongylus costaricensis]